MARWSQSTDTADCLVALALVVIHDTTRSTFRSTLVKTSGQMACLRCLRSVPRSPDTFAQSNVQAVSSLQAGSAATAAEEKKINAYSDIVSDVDFSPFAIETSGVCGMHAPELVTEIGRRIANVTHDPRSTMFLRLRLSGGLTRQCLVCSGSIIKQ